MELTDEVHGGVILVKARGRLDGSSSQEFSSRMEMLTKGASPRVVLDFGGIDFVSSAGLRVVLSLLKRVRAANGKIALCAVSGPIREIFEITGFSGMLDLHGEREAALAALS